MADTARSIKDMRDMFLAFSFSSADFFVEVGDGGNVAFTFGASKTLTGIDDKEILGKNWLNLFSFTYHAELLDLIATAKVAKRFGPFQVQMDETQGGGRQAILTGIRMPGSDKFYISIGFPTDLMSRLAGGQKKNIVALQEKDAFVNSARDVMNVARSVGQNVDLTLIDLPEVKDLRKRMGANWDKFNAELTEALGKMSADGESAARLTDARYSVLHDKSVIARDIQKQVDALLAKFDPEAATHPPAALRTVSSDLKTLSDREASKALVYTLNEFERKGVSVNINDLNSGFKVYVTNNAHKIQQFKNMVETLNFELYFQPIVALKTLEGSHYEMLTRFRGGEQTQEWIMFGEDIGMIPDFDMAVVERSLNYLQYQSPGQRTKFAVNLSGQSIQSEEFFKKLFKKVTSVKGVAERIMFEITESTEIKELDRVASYIDALREAGFKTCMDDFGAGAASFQYLQKLKVDYVKIDGQYTRKLMESERDRVMVKNLGHLCADLGIAVVAEQIETQDQADLLADMDIGYGQGYLFGKAMPKPSYAPPTKS